MQDSATHFVFLAYIDPGFTGTLYQFFYFLVFGVALGWIVKPYRMIKEFFSRGKKRAGASASKSDGPSRTEPTP